MEIKVTYEKVYDSNEYFEQGCEITETDFISALCEDITDWIDMSEKEWKFEKNKRIINDRNNISLP